MPASPAANPVMQTGPQAFDENAVLADYLYPELSLLEIAQRHAIPLIELMAWIERPDIEAFLARYENNCNTRARRLAAFAAPQAVETTIRCLTSDKPETARRAASAIVRLAKPPKEPQSHKRIAATSDDRGTDLACESQTPSTPTPASGSDSDPTPTPSLPHNCKPEPSPASAAPPLRAAA